MFVLCFSRCLTPLYQTLPSTDLVCQRGIYPLGRFRGRSKLCLVLFSDTELSNCYQVQSDILSHKRTGERPRKPVGLPIIDR